MDRTKMMPLWVPMRRVKAGEDPTFPRAYLMPDVPLDMHWERDCDDLRPLSRLTVPHANLNTHTKIWVLPDDAKALADSGRVIAEADVPELSRLWVKFLESERQNSLGDEKKATMFFDRYPGHRSVK